MQYMRDRIPHTYVFPGVEQRYCRLYMLFHED